MLDYCMPESRPAEVEKLPVTVFSGVYNRSSGSPVLKRYTGIILVEINRLANRSEAEKIREKATDRVVLRTCLSPAGRGRRGTMAFGQRNTTKHTNTKRYAYQ